MAMPRMRKIKDSTDMKHLAQPLFGGLSTRSASSFDTVATYSVFWVDILNNENFFNSRFCCKQFLDASQVATTKMCSSPEHGTFGNKRSTPRSQTTQGASTNKVTALPPTVPSHHHLLPLRDTKNARIAVASPFCIMLRDTNNVDRLPRTFTPSRPTTPNERRHFSHRSLAPTSPDENKARHKRTAPQRASTNTTRNKRRKHDATPSENRPNKRTQTHTCKPSKPPTNQPTNQPTNPTRPTDHSTNELNTSKPRAQTNACGTA